MTTKIVAERLKATNCKICWHVTEHGWHGMENDVHCTKCHRTWPRREYKDYAQAHCAVCHRHFLTSNEFDAHLKDGTDGRSVFHLDPFDERLFFTQDSDGMWARSVRKPVSPPAPQSFAGRTVPLETAQTRPPTPPPSPATVPLFEAPKTLPWLPKPIK